MEGVLHAVAAGVGLRTHHLDPDNVGGVRGEVRYLDGVFLQNQDCVGGHVALAVVILQDQSGWVRYYLPQTALGLNCGEGEENKSSLKCRLTFLRYISS